MYCYTGIHVTLVFYSSKISKLYQWISVILFYFKFSNPNHAVYENQELCKIIIIIMILLIQALMKKKLFESMLIISLTNIKTLVSCNPVNREIVLFFLYEMSWNCNERIQSVNGKLHLNTHRITTINLTDTIRDDPTICSWSAGPLYLLCLLSPVPENKCIGLSATGFLWS